MCGVGYESHAPRRTDRHLEKEGRHCWSVYGKAAWSRGGTGLVAVCFRQGHLILGGRRQGRRKSGHCWQGRDQRDSLWQSLGIDVDLCAILAATCRRPAFCPSARCVPPPGTSTTSWTRATSSRAAPSPGHNRDEDVRLPHGLGTNARQPGARVKRESVEGVKEAAGAWPSRRCWCQDTPPKEGQGRRGGGLGPS